MHTTNLRKVGGSIMLAVPPALLDVLHLTAGAKVGLAVDNGRLVVEPAADRLQIFRIVGEMGAEEDRLGMSGDDPIAGRQQLLAAGPPRAVKAPVGMPGQLLPALVGFVNRQKECRRIGRVDDYRQP